MLAALLEWVLIILVIVIIFNANNLSSWKASAHKKLEELKKVASDKKVEIENKINAAKNKKDKDDKNNE